MNMTADLNKERHGWQHNQNIYTMALRWAPLTGQQEASLL